jgi:hypothetical protein
MTLENQVCSLPFAQRLKELGVKQESYFHWRLRKAWGIWNDCEESECAYSSFTDECSAFTVAELGDWVATHATKELLDQLPEHLFEGEGMNFLSRMLSADTWANIAIYLLENELITV